MYCEYKGCKEIGEICESKVGVPMRLCQRHRRELDAWLVPLPEAAAFSRVNKRWRVYCDRLVGNYEMPGCFDELFDKQRAAGLACHAKVKAWADEHLKPGEEPHNG